MSIMIYFTENILIQSSQLFPLLGPKGLSIFNQSLLQISFLLQIFTRIKYLFLYSCEVICLILFVLGYRDSFLENSSSENTLKTFTPQADTKAPKNQIQMRVI